VNIQVQEEPSVCVDSGNTSAGYLPSTILKLEASDSSNHSSSGKQQNISPSQNVLKSDNRNVFKSSPTTKFQTNTVTNVLDLAHSPINKKFRIPKKTKHEGPSSSQSQSEVDDRNRHRTANLRDDISTESLEKKGFLFVSSKQNASDLLPVDGDYQLVKKGCQQNIKDLNNEVALTHPDLTVESRERSVIKTSIKPSTKNNSSETTLSKKKDSVTPGQLNKGNVGDVDKTHGSKSQTASTHNSVSSNRQGIGKTRNLKRHEESTTTTLELGAKRLRENVDRSSRVGSHKHTHGHTGKETCYTKTEKTFQRFNGVKDDDKPRPQKRHRSMSPNSEGLQHEIEDRQNTEGYKVENLIDSNSKTSRQSLEKRSREVNPKYSSRSRSRDQVQMARSQNHKMRERSSDSAKSNASTRYDHKSRSSSQEHKHSHHLSNRSSLSRRNPSTSSEKLKQHERDSKGPKECENSDGSRESEHKDIGIKNDYSDNPVGIHESGGVKKSRGFSEYLKSDDERPKSASRDRRDRLSNSNVLNRNYSSPTQTRSDKKSRNKAECMTSSQKHRKQTLEDTDSKYFTRRPENNITTSNREKFKNNSSGYNSYNGDADGEQDDGLGETKRSYKENCSDSRDYREYNRKDRELLKTNVSSECNETADIHKTYRGRNESERGRSHTERAVDKQDISAVSSSSNKSNDSTTSRSQSKHHSASNQYNKESKVTGKESNLKDLRAVLESNANEERSLHRRNRKARSSYSDATHESIFQSFQLDFTEPECNFSNRKDTHKHSKDVIVGKQSDSKTSPKHSDKYGESSNARYRNSDKSEQSRESVQRGLRVLESRRDSHQHRSMKSDSTQQLGTSDEKFKNKVGARRSNAQSPPSAKHRSDQHSTKSRKQSPISSNEGVLLLPLKEEVIINVVKLKRVE